MKETSRLSDLEQSILKRAAPPEPPAGAEDRVFGQLMRSISAPAADLAPAQGLVTQKTVAAIAGAALLGGIGAGILLGRTLFLPEPPAPKIIERVVRVEVPVPAPLPPLPVVTPRKPPLPTSPREQAPPAPDALLAQERELIDTARSALLHGDAASAVVSLEMHAKRFATGRLAEERESLWIQALVMKGAAAEAKARAARFHQDFPGSLLGPVVDAAVAGP